jgi:hypothetical protein
VQWVFRHTAYDTACPMVAPENAPSRAVAGKVHDHMRELTWAGNGRLTCLYWTTRPPSTPPPPEAPR